MKSLLWKDYRVNRQLLIVGFCLLVAPYLAAIGWIWYDQGLTGAAPLLWANALAFAAQASLIFSVLTILLLSGHVIAGERRDRSAEFLCYLPPSRAKILTSKAILCAVVFAVIWGVHLVIADIVVPALSDQAGGQQMRTAEGRLLMLSLGIVIFGTGWMGSAMLESPTYSASIGIASAMVIVFAMNLCRTFTGQPETGTDFIRWTTIAYFTIGTIGFGLGWWYFVRRVEP